MALDKWIAVIFIVISLIYGYASYTYPLLPFERNMVFLPNTMPLVLSVLGIIFALIIVLTPKAKTDGEGDALGSINMSQLREYKVGQALALIGAMILYAVALRPVGFIAATTLFLVGTGWILGERKLHIMIPVALVGTGIIWFLVEQALGIFLRPLPWFLS
ncbi:MAG: tripartite tricarboxylate transporter TctB family protein [Gammaproteobacteria bacterium]|nr:tripartite tricarboxylate transporter TctB family protein [Gammaproteobacteria bacterium]